MGLREQPEYNAPEFEPMPSDLEVPAGMAAEDEEMAKAAATAAITKASSTAVGAVRPRLTKAFADKELAIPIDDVRQWFIPSPSITSVSGGCKHSEKGSLGARIVFEIDSYNVRFLVVPGVNDQEAKKLCRNSYDKVNLDEGGSVEAYLQSLLAQGYTKANVAEYCDLWGRVVWSEKYGVSDPSQDWDCRVQLSKTSASNFNYFCGKHGRLETAGLVPKLQTIEITATAKSGKTGDYTNFSFGPPPSTPPKA